ncbi:MAG: hypothetical protein WBD36_02515 [Bacteroidota bacterium]
MVAAGVVHKQKKIVAAFRRAGATSGDRATTVDNLGIHAGLAFRILRRHEILREANDEYFYLDEAAWEAHRARRHRIAFIILAICVVGGMAIYFWTRLG